MLRERSRVDLQTFKTKLQLVLKENSAQYWDCMRKFAQAKLTKSELDTIAKSILVTDEHSKWRTVYVRMCMRDEDRLRETVQLTIDHRVKSSDAWQCTICGCWSWACVISMLRSAIDFVARHWETTCTRHHTAYTFLFHDYHFIDIFALRVTPCFSVVSLQLRCTTYLSSLFSTMLRAHILHQLLHSQPQHSNRWSRSHGKVTTVVIRHFVADYRGFCSKSKNVD